MADIFDVNKYKSENNRLMLSPEQKRIISAEMYQAESVMKKERKSNLWVKGIAAALAVALIGGTAYFGIKGNLSKDNSFVIRASAAASGDEVNRGTNTKGYAMTNMKGWCTNSDGKILEKDGYKDIFAYYMMDDFNISGSNIKSVRFDSQTDGVYFTLNPNPDDYPAKPEDPLAFESALESFKEKNTLQRSQYTFNELREYATYYINWPCDGFSYEAESETSNEADILPNRSVDIIVESNHANPKIAAWLSEIAKISEPKYEPSDYTERDREKLNELQNSVFSETLKEAKIKVTVTYIDNTTETRTINLVDKGNGAIEFKA